jgi:hypothetical protein
LERLYQELQETDIERAEAVKLRGRIFKLLVSVKTSPKQKMDDNPSRVSSGSRSNEIDSWDAVT